MPADTKLYLYLNPRRLVSDSIWTFDARQFAGWVPHQMIAYVWPSGPWYVVAQALGLPDWVAHRLWVGTIMLAAGAGVAWAARRLGLSVEAAVAAGLLYQLSPYLVPYVSRTSSMLLPWAGPRVDRRADGRGGDAHTLARRSALRARHRHRRRRQHDRDAADRSRPRAVARRSPSSSARSRCAPRSPPRRASVGWRWGRRRGGWRCR